MGILARSLCLLAAAAASMAAGRAAAQDAACVPPPGIAEIQQAVIKTPRRDRGLLWRLEKDGRTSWLYGTVHVGRLEWGAPGPTIMKALAASDVLVLELDLTQAGEQAPRVPPLDAGASARVLAGGLDERLKSALKQGCVPEAAQSWRPAMQVVMLTVLSARSAGLHPELGIDWILTAMAPHMGKRIVALETVAGQMKAMLPASESEEREMIVEAIDPAERLRARAQLARMVAAWERSDADDMAAYPQWCDCLKTDLDRAMMRRMNDDRNPAMADKMAALHGEGTRFFAAVGALHMTGPQSLVTLLRARGFDVQRVAFDGK
ncbi:TraB/GumN family protein [Ramlibacter sp. PS4R-6]|uniref:TraB/GumN family protein n=1 Tax=Ramlibacter sp. PS4R-6 TaxID=3133438 RepID=UPI0030A8E53F